MSLLKIVRVVILVCVGLNKYNSSNKTQNLKPYQSRFYLMWRRARAGYGYLRRFSTVVRRRSEDEGDWLYSSEWWGSDSDDGHTVLRSTSGKGNGVVSVVAYHSSRPVRFFPFSKFLFPLVSVYTKFQALCVYVRY